MKTALLLAILVCSCAAQTDLRIAVFITGTNSQSPTEFTGLGVVDGTQFRVATELAVEAVNNSTELLQDYNLQAIFVDSQCSPGPSVRQFIDQIFNPAYRILIIGADCSTASEPIAELAPPHGLVQISPLSTSPVFSNEDDFQNFLRLIPSDSAAAVGVVNLMENFGWSRLGIITQQENGFASVRGLVRQQIEMLNFTIVSDVTFNTGDDPRPFLLALANSPVRVIFLNVYPLYAVDILCLAHEQGMTNENGYQWLLYPWYPQDWWMDSNETRSVPYETVTCPHANIQAVLNRAIVIDYLPMADEGSNQTTPVGLNVSQYKSMLGERLSNAQRNYFDQTYLYFDSLLLAALALHKTAESYDLSQFDYNTSNPVAVNITRELYSNALSTSFYGVSGQVDFTGGRDRLPETRFKQYTLSETAELQLTVIANLSDIQSIFPIPDRVPTDEEQRFIAQPLFIALTIVSGLGVACAVGVAIFLMVFRQRTIIKYSSPYLNLLIIAGTILFFIDVILFGIDEGTPADTCTVNGLCMARIWIAVLAFDLLFGTIFLKTWRAYYAVLSRNRRRKKGEKTIKMKIVPDWGLAVALLVAIAVDLILLIIVTILEETRLTLRTFPVDLTPNSRAIPVLLRVCTAQYAFIWLIILGVLKAIPLLIGLLLAFDLRSTKISKLNDSKTIGLTVYGVAIMTGGAVIIGALLNSTEFVDVFYGVVSALILLNNIIILLLLFVPKIYKLHKDPEGLRVLVSPDPHMSSTPGDTVAGLTDEIQRLKSELDELNGERNGHTLSPEVRPDKAQESNDSALTERKSVHFSED